MSNETPCSGSAASDSDWNSRGIPAQALQGIFNGNDWQGNVERNFSLYPSAFPSDCAAPGTETEESKSRAKGFLVPFCSRASRGRFFPSSGASVKPQICNYAGLTRPICFSYTKRETRLQRVRPPATKGMSKGERFAWAAPKKPSGGEGRLTALSYEIRVRKYCD
jgi:hypothetical protein